MPDIYQENKLFRLVDQKQVWVYLNGSKHAFANGGAFMNRGYDFGDVEVIRENDREYVNILPVGSTLY